ncbi:hypothetical protein CC86DRAFT_6296 [Ophiobolus disseminans]|uniref:Uncharacterized protein n=1 Tax=Ophiobolus disseminans TaxID=1469910 RepID=A0A6A7AIS7_9PLEO|nr:hypothetical protein CC86DRAFT_6296 [Ophiobolus disseminans]
MHNLFIVSIPRLEAISCSVGISRSIKLTSSEHQAVIYQRASHTSSVISKYRYSRPSAQSLFHHLISLRKCVHSTSASSVTARLGDVYGKPYDAQVAIRAWLISASTLKFGKGEGDWLAACCPIFTFDLSDTSGKARLFGRSCLEFLMSLNHGVIALGRKIPMFAGHRGAGEVGTLVIGQYGPV